MNTSDGTPTTRLRGAALMQPGLSDRVFDEETARRLELLVDIPPTAWLHDLADESARRRVGEAEILITGWGCPRLTTDVLRDATRLRAIVHAGGQAASLADDDALDLLRERGVALTNAGEANAIPVAEYCLAMILLANKAAFRSERLYRERRAPIDREAEFPAAGNFAKTVGLVTVSRISRVLIELLRPYEIDVIAWSRSLDDEQAGRLGVRSVGLDELMATSDIVSLHTPLVPATVGMIDARLLGLMKDGATLLNTARGPIVDREALLGELRSGRINAILDVTEPEPLPAVDELWALPNVVLTPHMAGSVGTELRRMGRAVLSEIERLRSGVPPEHAEAY